MSGDTKLEKLKEKFYNAVKTKAVLQEKTKLLSQQAREAKEREKQTNHVVNELLERQRELAFMLHRANTVLHRFHEANAALSAEFTDLVKELPAPSSPDWEERVAKINELFKKTGDIATEVEGDIFQRGLDSAMSAATEVQPVPEAAAAAPIIPPTLIVLETAGPVAEPVKPAAEAEAEEEPTPEPEAVTIPETEEPDLSAYDKKLDRLFGKARAGASSSLLLPDADEAPQAREASPGVLSRIWRRIRRRYGKETVPTEVTTEPEIEGTGSPREITDEPEPAPPTPFTFEESLEDDQDEIAASHGVEVVWDETSQEPELTRAKPAFFSFDEEPEWIFVEPEPAVAESVETEEEEPYVEIPQAERETVAPIQAVDELWEDAEQELESIDLQIPPGVTVAAPEPVAVEGAETPGAVAKPSLIDRVKSTVTGTLIDRVKSTATDTLIDRVKSTVTVTLDRHSGEAIERARARRRERRDRRIGPDKPESGS